MIRRFVQNAGALVLLGVFASGVSAQEEAKPKAIPHDTEGRAECLTCHSGAVEGIKGAPETHEGRGNDSCLWCHAADSPMLTTGAKAIPHDMAGKDNCMMCHTGNMPGATAPPESHEGRPVEACQWCHKPAG